MKRVSVIIPTYNRMHFIEKSVRSVLEQSYPVSEVIVVDDCSADQTGEVVQGIDDDRVRYIRLDANKGAGGARNAGVANAGNDLIAFQDSDDEWLPDKLEKQMAYYDRHPSCGLVYSAYEIALSSGEVKIVPHCVESTVGELEDGRTAAGKTADEKAAAGGTLDAGIDKMEGRILRELLIRNSVGAPTMLIPKKVFEEVGGFDEKMRCLEDWDLAIRIAEKFEIGFVQKALVRAGNTQNGVSSAVGAYYESRCYMLRKYRTEYLALGVFEEVAKGILTSAAQDQVLDQVNRMLVAYLSAE